jgi:radical SAM enzyme (TIGR01210 family)
MCDLWKNTTDFRVPAGAIPSQIEWALDHAGQAKHIKLYNSGNFFDSQAIPPEDYKKIASLLSDFETVIVESHPKLINEKVLRFRDMLKAELQVAIGLETAHKEVLHLLNKKMNLQDFKIAVQFLGQNNILTRAFILLRPPFQTEPEGVEWAKRSIDYAVNCGVECCVIIPTRTGNGAIERLQEADFFSPPDIKSLEEVVDYGMGLKKGRVFADLWDLEQFSTCSTCFEDRLKRLKRSNDLQQIQNPIICFCN